MREAIIKVRLVDFPSESHSCENLREERSSGIVRPPIDRSPFKREACFFFPSSFPKLKKCHSFDSTILENPPSPGTIFLTRRLEKARIDRYIYKRIPLELIAVK